MRQLSAIQIINWMWLIWVLNWLVSALFVKKTETKEPGPRRLAHLVLFGAGLLMIYGREWQLGSLDRRFIAPNATINGIAVCLSAAGLILAFWARSHIGQYWSASIALKQDHRVVQTGPYAYLRHPIYTGILLAFLGQLLVTGQYRGILGLGLIIAALVQKALSEEGLLLQSLGAAYLDYRRNTGFLLPKINLGRG